MNKFQIQEDEYVFPYHYLTSLNNNLPLIYKRLSWGYEYITYIDFIRKYIEDEIKPKSILDVGCGDGFLINSLHFNELNKFKGIDLSKKAINFANAFSDGYEFECVDLFDIKVQFQLVCLVEVLEHIPDLQIPSFIEEAFEKVEKGGYFIVCVPTTVDKVHKKHFRHYDESLISRQISQKNFKIIKQLRLYKKSKLLEKLVKFSQKNNSKTIKKFVWIWHKRYTYFANQKNGKHLITIYQKTP
jgi:2-polyprenyl-3-methyl-5-hydroxy-6-metoxy-1,4-benzoquinol methylase